MIDYQKVLSPVATGLKPSGIRKFFDLLDSMQDVVGLTVGQPDFVTPWHIREAAIDSLKDGKTYYTSNAGLPQLRQEIAKYLDRRFELKYSADEVLVTVGGSEAIDLAIRACITPGDEVIIPTPCFVCYDPIVRLVGGVPVTLETRYEDKFKVNPEMLKKAITPRTKMIVLAYPNNPTGAIMTREELEDIADIVRDTNIVILSDEIYSELTFGRRHTSIATLPEMRERTIIASGFSKAYAMTGWRMGYIAAPKEIFAQILKIHQYCIMCAPTTSQFAAIEAIKNGDEDIERMKDEYDRRRRYLLSSFKDIGIECFVPEGAFYAFPNVGRFGLTSEEFCQRLLNEFRCAIVPGTAFGDNGEGFARISYAYSIKHIDQALERIEAFIKTL